MDTDELLQIVLKWQACGCDSQILKDITSDELIKLKASYSRYKGGEHYAIIESAIEYVGEREKNAFTIKNIFNTNFFQNVIVALISFGLGILATIIIKS